MTPPHNLRYESTTEGEHLMRVIGEVEARVDRIVDEARDAAPRGTADPVRDALIKQRYELDSLTVIVARQGDALLSMQKERDSALKWGIGALGSVLFAIATWAVNFVAGHLK